jgi:peptide/nickel transport system substrate-binding protein
VRPQRLIAMTKRMVGPAVVLALSATLVAGGCSASKTASSSTGTSNAQSGSAATAKAPATLNMAFNADMQVPDPDIFYEVEGNAVMTSVYEGLIRYAPNATDFEPSLAESYSASADGLTYTFKLRSGVTFHDGTAMTSNDAKASFTRRSALGSASAPGYMLADVAGYDTPDPTTFVIHLKEPVSAFLDYLASPYGPKVLSSATLTSHAGSDLAQSWLKNHDAGTGPYTMSEFTQGDHYTLTAVPNYWGTKPAVTTVHIAILPDITTQQLELTNGQLQLIMHGLSKNDIASYEHNPKFQVQRFPANFKSMLMVNQNKGIFKSQELRTALQSAINRQQIVSSVYGDANAQLSTQTYPTTELPGNLAVDSPKFDPALLASAAKSLANKKVDVGYTSDDARNQLAAELIQTELQAAGLDATTRGITLATTFDLPNHPDQAPDLLMTVQNPDASHPDNWARIFQNTKGSLNWLQCSVPAADTEMDLGLHATTINDVQAHYGKAGDLLQKAACFDNIADVKEIVVAQAGYTGWSHQLSGLFTVRFASLKLN